MSNQLIELREFPSLNSETIGVLSCNKSIALPTPVWHNHYVRFIFCSEKNKVKYIRATYYIQHFWKQNSSANNFLPNFADDLNVHENPNISKSSTSNIIADTFSSLDNNFLKLNGTEQPFISKSPSSDCISISTSVNNSFPPNFTVSCSKIKYYLASSTGIQGKTLVSNCTTFQDITSKCILSTVPVTNTSCNMNTNKKSYSSL